MGVVLAYEYTTDPARVVRPWNAAEYRSMFAEAYDHIDAWEPLDSACTFDQYAARFGFGGPPGSMPPLLRVEEGGEWLRVRSYRYRRFKQQQQKPNSIIEELNTDRQAFGWARYNHKGDDNSIRALVLVASASVSIMIAI